MVKRLSILGAGTATTMAGSLGDRLRTARLLINCLVVTLIVVADYSWCIPHVYLTRLSNSMTQTDTTQGG